MNPAIRTEITRALKQCGTFLLPEPTLRTTVTLALPGDPTATQIADELRAMEIDGLVVPGHGPLGVRMWKLTAAGDALASELRL